MSVWKLVSGILSIVLAVFVFFQSSIAGLSNALSENGESGGSAGVIVAICMLAGGIISIVTRNGGRAASIALVILFGIAAICDFSLVGSYSDLTIWAGWCLICMLLALIAAIRGKREK